MARWPRDSSDAHWPQTLGPPNFHHVDEAGSSPVETEAPPERYTQTLHMPHPWIGWAQQPWLAACLGERQL